MFCQSKKAVEGSVGACFHDLENLLQASGHYRLDWLRQQRLVWHPDRFGLRCDPDFRDELKRKATEMFALFQILIEQEEIKEKKFKM